MLHLLDIGASANYRFHFASSADGQKSIISEQLFRAALGGEETVRGGTVAINIIQLLWSCRHCRTVYSAASVEFDRYKLSLPFVLLFGFSLLHACSRSHVAPNRSDSTSVTQNGQSNGHDSSSSNGTEPHSATTNGDVNGSTENLTSSNDSISTYVITFS